MAAEHTIAVELTLRYLELIRRGDAAAVGALFADDGVLRPPPPARGEFVGPAAVRDFYAGVFARGGAVSPEPGVFVSEQNRCVVTLTTSYGDQTHEFCDIFTVSDDGKISEMVAYRRD